MRDRDGCNNEINASMRVRVGLLHNLLVHELLQLLLGKTMHQFACLVGRLEVLAVLAHFVDMHLFLLAVVQETQH